MEKNHKKMIVWVLIYFFVAGLAWAVFFIVNFPKNYPNKTLEIEVKINQFFERITLPIKIAKLSAKDPDSQVLMPAFNVRLSQVADTWMEPRENGRAHEGQDFFAPRGTPVFSATFGYIIRIIRDSNLGGNAVTIIGAGGRRYYYAHMDRFADNLRVGQEVAADTVIGFVGNSGNAGATPPHLHFGVYQSKEAIDPLSLLTDRP